MVIVTSAVTDYSGYTNQEHGDHLGFSNHVKQALIYKSSLSQQTRFQILQLVQDPPIYRMLKTHIFVNVGR